MLAEHREIRHSCQIPAKLTRNPRFSRAFQKNHWKSAILVRFPENSSEIADATFVFWKNHREIGMSALALPESDGNDGFLIRNPENSSEKSDSYPLSRKPMRSRRFLIGFRESG